eukprot:TRINITY_DN3240_c0_g1_i10.p2 TRINITY_DN3240_c0_g1~~TRINITY_DN3240_c0_g1_i10.p2  ORF type:complete len:161 (+),score=38.31 TRINITY_DN3240_c0_g1_i10:761-1243(+)
MSRELWELLNAVKLNKNHLVRRNCVFALSRILLVLPDYVLSEEFEGNELEEVLSWLVMTAWSDPDEICKDCSIMCVKTLSDIFKVTTAQNQQRLQLQALLQQQKEMCSAENQWFRHHVDAHQIQWSDAQNEMTRWSVARHITQGLCLDCIKDLEEQVNGP